MFEVLREEIETKILEKRQIARRSAVEITELRNHNIDRSFERKTSKHVIIVLSNSGFGFKHHLENKFSLKGRA